MPKHVSGGPLQTAPLMALLENVGVRKSSLMRVTGASALPALIWFCRHGYRQVGYVRPDEGCPHEDPDAIIVAHPCNELEVKRILPIGRHVRPGGVLIFQIRTAEDAVPAGLEWLLEAAGFTCERQLPRGGRLLVIARRLNIGLRKAA